MNFQTPLRYPGGKARLGPWIAWMMRHNKISGGTYVEPYAGGAGAAIYLLQNHYVRKIIINDLDPAIYCFWHSVLNETDRLVRKINRTGVNMKVWSQQKKILERNDPSDPLKLGFAAFYLNRTNRSGILTGGVIGGKSQNGDYKLDARYNKENLIDRIKKISLMRNQIELHNEDALKLLKKLNGNLAKKSLIYLDPPYFNKASQLYQNFYEPNDHKTVCETVKKIKTPWIVTYDNCKDITKLYSKEDKCEFSLKYSTHVSRPDATEIMIYNSVELPSIPFLHRSSRPYPSTWQ